MKRKGSTIEHSAQRNQELKSLFNKYFCEGVDTGGLEIYNMIVKSPASRFWVSEDRATDVIGRMRRGLQIKSMYEERQRMYQEIYSRYLQKSMEQPERPMSHIVFEVVNSPAPEFYLSPRTAGRIISEMRRGAWRR